MIIDLIKYGVLFVFACAGLAIAFTAGRFLWELWKKGKL